MVGEFLYYGDLILVLFFEGSDEIMLFDSLILFEGVCVVWLMLEVI